MNFALRKVTGLVLAAVVLLLTGCGSDSERHSTSAAAEDPVLASDVPVIPRFEGETLMAERLKVKSTHWRVGKRLGGESVEIFSAAGYCLGESPPQFIGYRLIEKGKDLLITPYVVQIRPHKPLPGGLCRGVGYWQEGILPLGRDLDHVKLYDATTSPPSLRWPKLAKE